MALTLGSKCRFLYVIGTHGFDVQRVHFSDTLLSRNSRDFDRYGGFHLKGIVQIILVYAIF